MRNLTTYSILAFLLAAFTLVSCKDEATTEPTPETEVVQCSTSIDGGNVVDGSKFIIATVKQGSVQPGTAAFLVMGFAIENPDIKNKVEDGISIAFAPTAIGTYRISYPFGPSVGITYNGMGYIVLQGTIIVTRLDAVGGWVEGTFEGTANSQDGTKQITVTKGVFRVNRDADGMLG